MPAISLPIVPSDSKSPATLLGSSPTSSGPSFASFLAANSIARSKSNTGSDQQKSPTEQPGNNSGNFSITANLLKATDLSLTSAQPAIKNSLASKGGEASAGAVKTNASAPGVNTTDGVGLDSAVIDSTAGTVQADTPPSALAGKIKPTTATPHKKDGPGSASLALSIAALVPPQRTASAPPITSGSNASTSAGVAIGDTKLLPELRRSQITSSASSKAFAQEAGTQTQLPTSSVQFDATATTKTALASPPLDSVQADSKEQSETSAGRDAIMRTPASPRGPQDAPLALPFTDPMKPLETISLNLTANVVASVDAQTYPQSSAADLPPLATANSPLTGVNLRPQPAESLATESAIPKAQLVTQSGLATPPSVSNPTDAIGDTNAQSAQDANRAPTVNLRFDNTNLSLSAANAEAVPRTTANFISPIQIPKSETAVKHPAQGFPSIPASAPPNSSQHVPVASRTEVAESTMTPAISQSSGWKASSVKTDATSPLQSTDQNSRPEKPHAANSAGAKADSSKTNTPAKAAGNDSLMPQNSGPDPKTASPLPLATPTAASPANSQADSASNAGPLIASVQSATNTSANGTTSQVKPEPALDNTPRPEPAPPQVARIFHTPSQSEMHVGLRTESFGAVDVRTTISEKQVEVSLGSERGDLKGFMVSEMPALQSNLQQHDLRLQTLRTIAPAYTTQADVFSGAGGERQDSPRQSAASRTTLFEGHETVQSEDEAGWTPRSGLSVRI